MSQAIRQVRGLRRAWLERPRQYPPPAGAQQRAGLAYERRVAAALPLARRGIWYGFEDEAGYGICSPDLVWVLGAEVVVFECKLTDRPEAKAQLLGLYLPVAAAVHCRSVRGVVVVKHTTRESTLVVSTLEEALAIPAAALPTLHWLGTAPGLLAMPEGCGALASCPIYTPVHGISPP